MFTLGGIVGYIHRNIEEVDLFKLGIIAPAILLQLTNGHNLIAVENQREEDSRDSTAHSQPAATGERTSRSVLDKLIGASLFAPRAYAQEIGISVFGPPTEEVMDKVKRGLGLVSLWKDRKWYVIVGYYSEYGDAEDEARKASTRLADADTDAEVYVHCKGARAFAVVIGSRLLKQNARRLRREALAAGFPDSTHLWEWRSSVTLEERYMLARVALDHQKWAEAIGEIEQAICTNPRAGEAIRPYGNYFVTYLPYYYLGDAFYRLGNCAGALREWEESESQGVIRSDPGYDSLIELRKNCLDREE